MVLYGTSYGLSIDYNRSGLYRGIFLKYTWFRWTKVFLDVFGYQEKEKKMKNCIFQGLPLKTFRTGPYFPFYTVNTQKVFNLCIRNLQIWLYISAHFKFVTSISFFTALAGLEMIAWNTTFENYPPFYCPITQKVFKLCKWYFHIPWRCCMWLFMSNCRPLCP